MHLYICDNISAHEYRYFFSWRDPSLQGVEHDWLAVRNFCRKRCMDSVSLETSNENEWIKQRLVGDKVSNSYTNNRILSGKAKFQIQKVINEIFIIDIMGYLPLYVIDFVGFAGTKRIRYLSVDKNHQSSSLPFIIKCQIACDRWCRGTKTNQLSKICIFNVRVIWNERKASNSETNDNNEIIINMNILRCDSVCFYIWRIFTAENYSSLP